MFVCCRRRMGDHREYSPIPDLQLSSSPHPHSNLSASTSPPSDSLSVSIPSSAPSSSPSSQLGSSAPSHTSPPIRAVSYRKYNNRQSLLTPVSPKLYTPSNNAQKKQYTFPPTINDEPLSTNDDPLSAYTPTLHVPSLICVMSLGFFANVEYGVIMPSVCTLPNISFTLFYSFH